MSRPRRGAALVTGGAIRLGRELALALARAGYDIALHYFSSEEEAEQTRREIEAFGVRCELFGFDLSDTPALPTWMAAVAVRMGNLEVLVNSASGYTQATIADTESDDFDQLFALNLKAPFFLIQAFARQVQRGNIINILDNKIAYNQFSYAAYLLSKKGLAELTRMAALEFAPAIRVNGIAPGVTLPAESRSADYLQWRIEAIPLQRKGEGDHIAQALLQLLANDFITGQILVVDGGEGIAHVGRNAGAYHPAKV